MMSLQRSRLDGARVLVISAARGLENWAAQDLVTLAARAQDLATLAARDLVTLAARARDQATLAAQDLATLAARGRATLAARARDQATLAGSGRSHFLPWGNMPCLVSSNASQCRLVALNFVGHLVSVF